MAVLLLREALQRDVLFTHILNLLHLVMEAATLDGPFSEAWTKNLE